MLRLRVLSRVYHTVDSEVVPNVPVLVGLGPIFGPGEASPGSEAGSRGPDLAGSSSTFRAVTDDAGEALVEIPCREITRARRGAGRLWVRVDAPGMQRRSHVVELQDAEELRVVVVVRPGVTLRGRVLDARGEPRAAHVQATREGVRDRLAVDAGEDGWFELSFPEEGTFDVLAESADATEDTESGKSVWSGTAVRRGLVVTFDTELPLLELRLAGPGVVRGRVRTPDGEPVAGLALGIRVAEHAALLFAGERAEARELELSGAGGGAVARRVRTDAEGRFQAVGLRPGLFDVRPWSDARGAFDEPLTTEPVPSSGAPLELVFDRPRLVVRFVDLEGEPTLVEPAAVDLRQRCFRGTCLGGWPRSPELMVLAPPVLSNGQPVRFAKGAAIPGGGFAFDVERGTHYVIVLRGSEIAATSREVTIDGWLEVTLVARPRGETARVTIDTGVGAAGGQPFEGERRWPHPVLVLDQRYAPLCVSHANFPIELPAGSYRLAVGACTIHDTWRRTPSFPPPGMAIVDVTLSAGEDRRVMVDLEPTGSLVVTLAPDSSLGGRASLALRREGLPPLRVFFRDEINAMFLPESEFTMNLPQLGDVHESLPLLPGSYTLELWQAGAVLHTEPVTIHAGRSTPVSL